MPSTEMQSFFSWFQKHNGYIDTSVLDVVDFPPSEGGRGAVALLDIPANHVMFSIPRSLVLSPRTSTLPAKMGAGAWKKFGLHKGWAGLILCMMWEASRGDGSLWGPYFDTLPTRFDTPMFWSEEELQELKGTSVVDKLGKEEAENDYTNKVLPAIQSRPDIFAKDVIDTQFSLAIFHMMGTRISSRSFTLAKDEAAENEEQKEEEHEEEEGTSRDVEENQNQDEDVGNTSTGSAMDVDEPSDHDESDGEDDEDDDEDGGTEVAMVPLADILNARYKTENVKLFYERDALKMVSTREIKAGEQIWNTYGDLPNAELLRGYGHVDYLPLDPSFSFTFTFPFPSGESDLQNNESTGEPQKEYGNPGDTVDIRADLVVRCVLDTMEIGGSGSANRGVDVEEMIDWWLEEGGDDVFTLEHPSLALSIEHPSLALSFADSERTRGRVRNVPEELVLVTSLTPPLLSFIHLLQLTLEDWAKARKKGRPPKPVLDDVGTLRIVLDLLGRRMGEYCGDVEEDRRLTQQDLDALPTRKRHALIVRLGEKRVVDGLRRFVQQVLAGLEKEKEKGKGKAKEKEREKTKTMSRAEKRKAGRDADADGWDVEEGQKEKGGKKRRK